MRNSTDTLKNATTQSKIQAWGEGRFMSGYEIFTKNDVASFFSIPGEEAHILITKMADRLDVIPGNRQRGKRYKRKANTDMIRKHWTTNHDPVNHQPEWY